MWHANLNKIPEAVLTLYGQSFEKLSWVPVSGGFSGASVWRGEDAQGKPRFALKQWPAETSLSRLVQIHSWMEDAAYLPFVPSLLSTREGTTIAQQDNCIWDAVEWLPGHTCIPANQREVECACEAVAEIHIAWSRYTVRSTSAGIQRRVEVLSQWLANPNTTFSAIQPGLNQIIQLAIKKLERITPIALEALLPWEKIPQLLQPCIRDLRPEHVLFEEGCVTGLVDYGAMAIDCPVFDLARLVGELAGDNEELFSQGLKKYRDCWTTVECSDRFVRLLDRVGTVCSLIGWLVRLSNQPLSIPTENIENRLLHLIVRAEQIKSIRSI
jgi:homoserine kinase type II